MFNVTHRVLYGGDRQEDKKWTLMFQDDIVKALKDKLRSL